jgi:hypothetical protein
VETGRRIQQNKWPASGCSCFPGTWLVPYYIPDTFHDVLGPMPVERSV